MKNLKLHSSGKDDLNEALNNEFVAKSKIVLEDKELSEEEKLKQIQELEIELKKKMRKAKWSLF